MQRINLNECLGLNKVDRKYYADPPPYTPNTVDQTVDYNGVTWKGQPGGDWTAQSATGGGGLPGAAPTLDVMALHNAAYNDPAIQSANSSVLQSQQKIDQINKALADEQAKINDNPYLSEATRIGRIQKLRDSSAMDIQNAQKELEFNNSNLTGLKTDAENKVNLGLKQFDINNQQYQQGVSQFNNLLSSGALSYANPSDLATIAHQTGMSISMIQSAVKASQAKNQQTQVIPFNDGTSQGYAVINPQTGEIINKQVIAGAAPTKYNTGGGSGSGSSVKDQTAQINLDKKQAPILAKQDAQNKMTLGTMMKLYAPYMSNSDIYKIYQNVNYYKATPAQQKADKKRYGIK